MKLRFKHILLLLLLFLIVTVVIDLIRISNYETIPMRPGPDFGNHPNRAYYDLANGQEDIDWKGQEQDLHKFMDYLYTLTEEIS